MQLLVDGYTFYISFIYVVLGLKLNSARPFEKEDLSRRTKRPVFGLDSSKHETAKL